MRSPPLDQGVARLIVYFLLIAILNLALGYALGVYFGWPLGVLPMPPPAPPDAATEDAGAVIMADNPKEGGLIQSDTEGQSPPPPEGDGVLDVALRSFTESVANFLAELVKIDARLAAGGQPHVAARECKTTLQQRKTEHQEQLRAALAQLDEHKEELADVAETSSKVQYVVQEQLKKVQANWACIEELDVAEAPEAAIDELAHLVRDLAGAAQYAVDELRMSQIRIDREEGRLAAAGPRDAIDPITGLAGRAAAEGMIARLWDEDDQRRGNLTLAVISVDQFQQVHFQHGLEAGQRVLAAVAEIIGSKATADELAVRFSGRQFLLVFPDKTPRQCSEKIEAIRQQIDQTKLTRGDSEVHVTVSCAVVAAAADDALETLFGRLDETVLEAKRYGRNRTFVHDGKYPAPLAPPALEIAAATVEL